MAIKGKGKTKSRQVARAPKPGYTPVRPLFFQRRWVQVTAAFLLGLGVVLFIAWIRAGLSNQTEDRERRERETVARSAMTEFKAAVEPALAQVGQQTPPIGFDAFPNLGPAIEGLGEGKIDEREVEATASSVEETASTGATMLEKLEPSEIVGGKGLGARLVSSAIDARNGMLQALRLYERSAILLARAVDAEGTERDTLIDAAADLDAVADEILTDA